MQILKKMTQVDFTYWETEWHSIYAFTVVIVGQFFSSQHFYSEMTLKFSYKLWILPFQSCDNFPCLPSSSFFLLSVFHLVSLRFSGTSIG